MATKPTSSNLSKWFSHALPFVLAALGGIYSYVQNNPSYATIALIIAFLIHLLSEVTLD